MKFLFPMNIIMILVMIMTKTVSSILKKRNNENGAKNVPMTGW